MSFDLAWLDLREDADRAARDAGLLQRAGDFLAAGTSPVAVDLGAGSGATMRAFGEEPPARWLLIDSDPALLAAAAQRGGPNVATQRADLRDLDALPLSGARLVTASALLDLASEAWVAALAERIAAHGAGFYAALNYDGHMHWTPVDPDDAAVADAFNRHQRGDKGFGPALGPAAGAHLEAAMRAKGYCVWAAPSPWRLGPNDAALQRALLEGIAAAASEAGCPHVEAWHRRRAEAIASGACTIGHVDVLALPAA